MQKILKDLNENLLYIYKQKYNILAYKKNEKYEKGNFIYFGFFNKELIYIGKTSNLNARLNNGHYSGRRSGSQFCVYFFDKYILPKICSKDIKIKNIDEHIKSEISNVQFYYCNVDLDICGQTLTQIENKLINFALDNYKSSILNKKSKS